MAASDEATFNEFLQAGASLHEGNFIIESLLAAGSFGATYVARDEILHRPVVIKEYFPEGCRRSNEQVIPSYTQDSESFTNAREHFLEEARVLAQFRHPGIVDVYNFFEANNTAYMVMEYLKGLTLLDVLTKQVFLQPEDVLKIARQVCDALTVVHNAEMLHRDIKPNNIIWCDDGRVVLIDFGLSEKFDNGTSRHTRPLDSTLRFGTPGYAPLEQYTHSAQLGPSSDVYALGATLYHLCSGQVPLPATDRACGVELKAPQCAHPVLSDCIMWAMSPEIKKRPSSIDLFWERINEADAVMSARKQLLSVLINRRVKKAEAAQVARLKKMAEDQPVDDGSCMKIIFIAYLAVWGFAAAAWFIFLFVRFVLVGG